MIGWHPMPVMPAAGLVDLTPENGFFNAPPTMQFSPDKNRFVSKH